MAAGLFIWGFGALFYLLGFFHRVAPAVITAELMQEFAIGAAALGNLSAVYFYSYVAMQIPTGILADRLGPRLLLSVGSLVAAAGSIIFALAPGMGTAVVGRMLIGGSVAVAFVCLLKIAANWFPPSRFALVSGLALFCGVAGAVFAGTPLRLVVDLVDWRSVMLVSAVIALATALGSWVFVRDTPREKGFRDFTALPARSASPQKTRLADILQVLRYRNPLLLFVIPAGIVGSILTFSGLWGVPYLTAIHDLSPARAAALTSTLLIAWAMGGPVFGWLSDRLKNRKTLYIAGCAAALAGWSIIIFIPELPPLLLVPVLLLTGFASGSMIISFAYAKESVPLRLAGTVSGMVNMGVMTGPMVLQPAIGWVLDRLWDGRIFLNVPVYDAASYRCGFSLMLAWLCLSLLLLFFTRETGCRQRSD